jgi:probable rRNA maturation factor
MKEAVLGRQYELSLVFIGKHRARVLNRDFRSKDKPANVLSFPLSDTEGEILICPQQARVDARKHGMDPEHFIAFLFIHGMLHLKGYRHGSRMESVERELKQRFALH